MIKYLLFILLSFIVVSCECVPGLDAPKEITPENSTECLFINAIEDNENIYLETDEIKISGRINYNSTNFEYKKVKSGNYFLKIKGNDSISVIYNSPINFKKDKRYIFAAAGIDYSIQTLILEHEYSSTNWTELVNLSGNSNPLEITIVTSGDTLKYSLSQFSSVKLDINNIKIDMMFIKNQNSELELNLKDIELKSNNILVFKGNNYSSKNTLSLGLIAI